MNTNIQTYTGKFVNPLNIRMSDIDIIDIAHALSQECRFGSHTQMFYSVAEHSLYVSRLLPNDQKLAGLLHDAHEAYIRDIPKPLKNAIPQYYIYQGHLQDKINRKFDINYVNTVELKKIESVVFSNEVDKVIINSSIYNIKKSEVLINIRCDPSKVIEYKFLKQFKRLYNGQ